MYIHKTYKFSNCFNLEIENGISPKILLYDMSLQDPKNKINKITNKSLIDRKTEQVKIVPYHLHKANIEKFINGEK